MFFVFYIIWIILNGSFDVQILLLGLPVCGALAVFCYRMMGYRLREDRLFFRRMGQELAYFGYLVKEIVVAALAIMRIIYAPKMELRPELIYFTGNMKTKTGRSVLANSITLTAGTITVDVQEDAFCIHTLNRPLAKGIENCPFARRLRTLEE